MESPRSNTLRNISQHSVDPKQNVFGIFVMQSCCVIFGDQDSRKNIVEIKTKGKEVEIKTGEKHLEIKGFRVSQKTDTVIGKCSQTHTKSLFVHFLGQPRKAASHANRKPKVQLNFS